MEVQWREGIVFKKQKEFFMACSRCGVQYVRFILATDRLREIDVDAHYDPAKYGDIPNTNYWTGCTALIEAAFQGRRDMVAFLVEEASVDVCAKDNHDGLTALITAASAGHVKVVEYLTQLPCFDVNQRDDVGDTALMRAIEQSNYDVVQFLVKQAGVNVNAQNIYGRNALMIAASTSPYIGVIEFLIKRPNQLVNVNEKDSHGQTALMFATMQGYFGVIKFLIVEARASVNERDCQGRTALALAQTCGFYGRETAERTIQLLKSFGATF